MSLDRPRPRPGDRGRLYGLGSVVERFFAGLGAAGGGLSPRPRRNASPGLALWRIGQGVEKLLPLPA